MQYVFITGGVASSLGKGIASAAVASLLQQRNFKVQNKKARSISKCRSWNHESLSTW